MPGETAGKTETLALSAPEKLNPQHDFSHFDCGVAAMWQEGEALLQPLLKEDLSAFRAAIETFDLEQALALLDRALAADAELARLL